MSKPFRLTVKLTPKASKNLIKGWAKDEKGNPYLKISVTSVPENGKANAALIEMLSEYTGIPRNAISIVRGAAARLKIIEIKGLDVKQRASLTF